MWLRVAIDGPAGSGKSTVAYLVARKRGLVHIDSGACYRAICYKALNRGVDLLNETALIRLSYNTDLQFRIDVETRRSRIIMDGEDITPAVRRPEVESQVSKVARVSGVRERVVSILRDPTPNRSGIIAGEGMIMDGRDIGSVVWPDAELKVFLTASMSTRARRRHREFRARGVSINLDELVRQIEERDRVDLERKDGPLVLLPDAKFIDSTSLELEQVVEKVDGLIAEVRSKLLKSNQVAVPGIHITTEVTM